MSRLKVLLHSLRVDGLESRIRAEIGPCYVPTTDIARGLLHRVRRASTGDAAASAKTIASVMLDARDEVRKLRVLLDTCEQQARDDERGRVLAAVADALADAVTGLRLSDIKVDQLLATLRAGRMPGGET